MLSFRGKSSSFLLKKEPLITSPICANAQIPSHTVSLLAKLGSFYYNEYVTAKSQKAFRRGAKLNGMAVLPFIHGNEAEKHLSGPGREREAFMASVSKCPYCGSDLRSDEKNCPGCGAPNAFYGTEIPAPTPHRPETLEDLKDYAAEHGMPLERMRFFLGKDVREPRAFGIFQDGDGDFVVYKNKSDGVRSIRYSGPDEARAVGELYDKLLSECHSRGIYPDGQPEHSSQAGQPIHHGSGSHSTGSGLHRGHQRSSGNPRLVIAIFVIFFLLFFTRSCSFPIGGFGSSSGYDSGYVPYYSSDYGDYGDYDDYDSDSGYSSWDDDDDWGSDWDSWDSSDTDWDSDW